MDVAYWFYVWLAVATLVYVFRSTLWNMHNRYVIVIAPKWYRHLFIVLVMSTSMIKGYVRRKLSGVDAQHEIATTSYPSSTRASDEADRIDQDTSESDELGLSSEEEEEEGPPPFTHLDKLGSD